MRRDQIIEASSDQETSTHSGAFFSSSGAGGFALASGVGSARGGSSGGGFGAGLSRVLVSGFATGGGGGGVGGRGVGGKSSASILWVHEGSVRAAQGDKPLASLCACLSVVCVWVHKT